MEKRITTSGISDISTSEGKLGRLTKICKLIRSERGVTRNRLEELIKKRIGSPFCNKKVTQRHLVILEKIGLIEKMGGIYLLSSEGKALCELTSNSSKQNELGFEERTFYFKTLFTSVLKDQLIKFLEVVRDHENEERQEVVGHYFHTGLAENLWNKAVIDRNLIRIREKGKIPTFFENKFGCMEMWLRDIGLVRKEKGKVMLKTGSKTLLNEITKKGITKDRIYELTGIALSCETIPFDYDIHRDKFLKTFEEAYFLFKTQSDISDIKSIRTFVCIDLLGQKIRMEEKEFDVTTKKLWKEGIIRSIMLGRDGKPAHVVLSKST